MAGMAGKIQKNLQIGINPYESIKDKSEIIKKAVLLYVPEEKIYLFGSYAYGEPREYSDIVIYY